MCSLVQVHFISANETSKEVCTTRFSYFRLILKHCDFDPILTFTKTSVQGTKVV